MSFLLMIKTFRETVYEFIVFFTLLLQTANYGLAGATSDHPSFKHQMALEVLALSKGKAEKSIWIINNR